MTDSAHQFIHLSGSPRERGIKYGKLAKERIHKVIEEYKVLFDKEGHISWSTAFARAQPFEREIAAFRPALIEEMKGIAEGAGVDFGVILLLNCRSEVLFAQTDECTAIGIPENLSYDGSVLLAQNWDWWSIGEGTTVLLEIDQSPLPSVLIATEAGLIGGKGLNSAGLGVTMNAMSVRKGQHGVPLQVLLREVQSQSTVPEALELIHKTKRAGSANIGLGSADGLLAMAEYTPHDLDVLLAGDAPLIHTNHWLSDYLKQGPEASQYSYRSTFTRLDRARSLCAKKSKFTPEDLFEILSDHAGNPDGICRHPDERLPIYHRHTSLWSMVIDLKKKKMWLSEGNPCCSEKRSYTFSKQENS